MASVAELQTKLEEIEEAISTAVARGLSRLTVGSVDKTYYSLAELQRLRDYYETQLKTRSDRRRIARTNMGY